MSKKLTAVLVVALIAVGCSSGGGSSQTTTPPAASSPAVASPPAGGSVTITMVDFAFQPSELAASVTEALELVNNGSALHNFTIEGSSVDVDVQPGGNLTLPPPAPIPPGTYTFFCKYHRAQGMEGTLTATA
jgi:plastocyanin